jgi:ABC-2 type transport system ATP-binding protein
MIEARGLTKKFGKVIAVESLDFQVPQGEVAGFLGPNGAGKTTTIRMITGYLPPSGGSAMVAGFDILHDRLAVQKRIGYLPESTPLYSEMRVTEFLKFRARLFGMARARIKPAISLALRRCWLDHVRRRPIGQLSKGYRQRVGLAAALLHEPPVLILDEPTVGLDPSQVREFRSLVRELAGRHTILLSSHLLSEVELTCDRVIMMARGRVLAAGTIDSLRTSAADACRYVVETTSADALDALSQLPGTSVVDETRIDDQWRRLTITAPRRSGDLREQIVERLQAIHAPIREVRREAPTLEHLFVKMIAEANSASAPAAEIEARPNAAIATGQPRAVISAPPPRKVRPRA